MVDCRPDIRFGCPAPVARQNSEVALTGIIPIVMQITRQMADHRGK
jgi:hypothetical protein